MAQAIATLGVLPVDPVNNFPYAKAADASADVHGIDLGSADLWFVQVKLYVKTRDGNSMTVALFMSDAVGGTGNVEYITPVLTLAVSTAGVYILSGMCNLVHQYLNIDVTHTANTFDYEVFAARVA